MEEQTWWQKHRRKVWIGIAVTTVVAIPFGSFILPAIYYKIRKKPDNKEQKEENNDSETIT